MTTRTERMLQITQADLAADIETLLKKFAIFEILHPQIWKRINENLYSQTDLNVCDLINLLETFSEITGENYEL